MTDDEADRCRINRVIGLISERVDVPGPLKVLDLACRTGLFSTALANLGCDVLGIEGRQENLDQAADSRARFELGDVRQLGRRDRFDVVLCLGILYHLEPAESLQLLAAMRNLTDQFAVVDTHVGADAATVRVGERRYHGCWYDEPEGPWSAIDNPRSFWFTEASLEQAITDSGWRKIEHIPGKAWPDEAHDRRWLVIS